MKSEDLNALTQEIEYYKSSHRYAECIQKMDQYEKETEDPVVRAVLLTATATCALQVDDISLADSAMSKIDTASLTAAMRNYVNLTKATIAHQAGRLDEAARVLSVSLASPDLYDDEQRDVLYEALARSGFVQADMNQFSIALDLLRRASTIFDRGELWDNINLYQGYCLQALGQLDEARERLGKVLKDGSGDLEADAYYRLGAVELQEGDPSAAIADFHNALASLPRGRIARSDVLIALREAEKQVTDLQTINNGRARTRPRIQ